MLVAIGSVSCGAWQMACRRVIKVGERVVKDLASTSWIIWTGSRSGSLTANHTGTSVPEEKEAAAKAKVQ